MKQLRYIIPVIFFTALLLVFPSSSLVSVKESLDLCIGSLVPSLFPFFVCSNLLVGLGGAHLFSKLLTPLMLPLFGLNGSCSIAIIMGYISGYPVGAKTAADLYTNGSCLKHEAEKMLAYCNNSGPMFIIGVVGSSMLGDSSVGIMIYISHILSSLAVGLLMRSNTICRYTAISSPNRPSPGFGETLSDSISSAVLLILTICGYVVMFGLIISFTEHLGIISALSSLGINYKLFKALIYGLFECSGGCKHIISAISSPLLRYMLLSSVIAWSGLSVHLQVLGIIKKAKLSSGLYFKGKILMTIISPVITMFIYFIKIGVVSAGVVISVGIPVLISAIITRIIKAILNTPRYRPGS